MTNQSPLSLKQESNNEDIIETGYQPREPQKEIHKAVKENRFVVAVCHRRMGKTVAAIMQLVHNALLCDKKKPQYAYIAPTYSQAKRIAWEYLVEYTRPLGATVRASELRVDFMGRRISLYGADSPDSLRGIYLDGCVIDEIGDVNPALFNEVIRPALSDRLGWAMFIGTPKGANHFKELRDFAADEENTAWALKEYKASQTGLIAEDELKDAKKAMGDNKYQHTSIPNFLAGNANLKPEKGTAWDLGMSDSTSIWVCETIGGEIRVMEYYEDHGKSLDHYIEWLKDNDYFNGYTHILPHDVMVRELGTGKSRYEILTEAGMNIDVARKMSVEDGIQAVRATLPSIWFRNNSTVNKGLECLRNYRRVFNEKLNVYQEKPLHDWSSHAADSFRYLCIGLDRSGNSHHTDWNKPIDSTYKNQYM